MGPKHRGKMLLTEHCTVSHTKATSVFEQAFSGIKYSIKGHELKVSKSTIPMQSDAFTQMCTQN